MTISRIIPDATDTYEQWQRAEHRDLAELDPARAWAELYLLRRHVAHLIWHRTRRLSIVRITSDGALIDERDWCLERIALLEQRLSRHGRAA